MDFVVDGLDFIQHRPHFYRRHAGVRQEIAKLVERTLEVDIVLPQRVVGVDDQVLAIVDLHTPVGHLECPFLGATTRAC